MEEVWKDIKGFEGMYQVSSLGHVKSLERQITGIKSKYIKERLLKQSPDGKGYLMVWLYYRNKRLTRKVHRLVAEAFVPNHDCKPQIDHVNGNKKDNRSCNLRWCTGKENFHNPISYQRNSESKYGEKNHHARPVRQYSKDWEFIKEWPCINDAVRSVGCSHSHIVQCCKGERKTTGGFCWSYVDNSNE